MTIRSARQLASTIFFCGLFVARSVHAQAPAEEPRFVKAAGLESEGKHEQAIELYKRISRDERLKSRALREMAHCYFYHLKDRDQALFHIQEAIDSAPTEGVNYIERGWMYQSLRMADRAVADGLLALTLPDTVKNAVAAHVNLGSAYLLTENFEKAMAQFDAALAIDSTDNGASTQKALTLDRLGRWDEATVILARLVEKEPENLQYLNNMGFVLGNAGRYAEAITYYDRVLAINKDEFMSLNNRGYAKLKSGDKLGALQDVSRSIELEAHNAYAYRNQALIMQALGRNEDACASIAYALHLDFTKDYGDEMLELRKRLCH